jgi:hypothetical protein
MKNTIILFLLAMLLLIMFSCADVSNVDKCLPADPYGFWSGLWHGWIVWISFIGSLFSDDIAVYAVNNTGGWYDFGFVLGFGGAGFTVNSTTRRR